MLHGHWTGNQSSIFDACPDYSCPLQICPVRYIFSSFANENISPGHWIDVRMRELEDHEVAFLNQFTGLHVTFWGEMMCCHDNSPCTVMQRHNDSRRAWHQHQPPSQQQNWSKRSGFKLSSQVHPSPVRGHFTEALCTPSSRSPDWLVEVGETLRHNAC